jgi:hypothetical protein
MYQKFIPIKNPYSPIPKMVRGALGQLSNGTNITQIGSGKVPNFACNKDTTAQSKNCSFNELYKTHVEAWTSYDC